MGCVVVVVVMYTCRYYIQNTKLWNGPVYEPVKDVGNQSKVGSPEIFDLDFNCHQNGITVKLEES